MALSAYNVLQGLGPELSVFRVLAHRLFQTDSPELEVTFDMAECSSVKIKDTLFLDI